MAITDSSLRSSIWIDLKSELDDATLEYYDNTDTSTTGVTITGSYIDKPESFPQVVLINPDISKEEYSFDRSQYTNTINILIDIYTKKTKNLDYIADQIDNISGIKTMNGLMLNDWKEDRAFETPGNNKLHLKTITLTYVRR